MMKLYFPIYEVEQSYACMHVKLLQLCLTLCDSMDCSPPSSSVHGILPQEYWNGFPWLPPGDLPDPGIKPTVLMSPALAGRFYITSATQESQNNHVSISRIMATGDSDGKESVCNAGDLGLIPG